LAGFATYRQTLESERLRQGMCPRCGYDLRGLNTARCPECGAKLRPPRAWLAESDKPGEDEDAA
jgi:rubrerythrin